MHYVVSSHPMQSNCFVWHGMLLCFVCYLWLSMRASTYGLMNDSSFCLNPAGPTEADPLTDMEVSWNGGTPISSIYRWFFHKKHPFMELPIWQNRKLLGWYIATEPLVQGDDEPIEEEPDVSLGERFPWWLTHWFKHGGFHFGNRASSKYQCFIILSH